MRNKKGVLPVVLCFYIAFGVVGAAAIWHTPGWAKVKQSHKDSDYAKSLNGNGGNFVDGNSN
jgi:hypothetical protein